MKKIYGLLLFVLIIFCFWVTIKLHNDSFSFAWDTYIKTGDLQSDIFDLRGQIDKLEKRVDKLEKRL